MLQEVQEFLKAYNTAKIIGSVNYCDDWNDIDVLIMNRDEWEDFKRDVRSRVKRVLVDNMYRYRIETDWDVTLDVINELAVWSDERKIMELIRKGRRRDWVGVLEIVKRKLQHLSD
jgi:hypothetical protein